MSYLLKHHPKAVYIGDGVHVDNDGVHLILIGNSYGRENTVYLDWDRMRELLRFAETFFGVKIAVEPAKEEA